MKNGKKLVAIVLVLIMLFAALSGCSDKPSLEIKNSDLIQTQADTIIFDISGTNENFTEKSFSWSFTGDADESAKASLEYQTLTPEKNLILDAKITDGKVEFVPATDQGTGIATVTLRVGTYQKTVFVKLYDLSKKLVMIDFDDGPSEFTEEILETLNNAGVSATFFVTGKSYHDVIHTYVGTEIHPETLKKTFASGHQIGNHTYEHPWQAMQDGNFPEGQDKVWMSYSESEVKDQVNRLDNLLYDLTGTVPQYYSAPFGYEYVHAQAVGKTLPIWELVIATHDWKTDTTKEQMVEKMCDAPANSIIVMHDVYQKTADALKDFLATDQAKDFQFVTFAEMDEIRNSYKTGDVSYSIGTQNFWADTLEELQQQVETYCDEQVAAGEMTEEQRTKHLDAFKDSEDDSLIPPISFSVGLEDGTTHEFTGYEPEDVRKDVTDYCEDQKQAGKLSEEDAKNILEQLDTYLEQSK